MSRDYISSKPVGLMKKAQSRSIPQAHAVKEVILDSWQEFHPYITKRLQDAEGYIFRGQRMSSWKLESSLDRALRGLGPKVNSARATARHLEQFRLAARARRGTNPQPLDEQGRWALGQHYGLWTPLLDWTESPFVALYFAFEEPNRREMGTRAVFGLCRPVVQLRCDSISKAQPSGSPARPDIVEFITPDTDENARLVSQGGLFTRGTTRVDIEKWVRAHFQETAAERVLVKIFIREGRGDRFEILKMLNRMNINHRSLFPDVEGSAKFCNMRLSVPDY
jgi:hypothetical protein